MAKLLLSYYKVGLAYLVWWLMWAAAQAFILHSLGSGWVVALTDAALTQLVLAGAGYAFNSSLHFYPPSQKSGWYALLGSFVLAIVCLLLQRWLIQQVLSEPLSLSLTETAMIIRGIFDWLMLILVGVLTWFWVYVSERHESEQRKEDATRLAREAELSNLRLQLQPHFLFNSLNSISALVGTQPSKAREMIHQLSDFLRGTVKREERHLITLSEELQHLQLYLEIEKVRFGHRLNTRISPGEGTLSFQLPSLVLQPIVENAIKFGLYDTTGEITITVTARLENKQLLIEVRNPFDPATAQPSHGTGFGLNSIRRRLYLLYFQNDLLATRQEETTFITTIKIPHTS